MKILYVTDIHGVEWKYETIFNEVLAYGVDMVINGGDLLPTRPSFFIQDNFITDYLDRYFTNFEEEGIFYLFQPANDDLQIHDSLLELISNKYDYIYNIAQKLVKIDEYEYIGFNLVTDLPFGLKDRARMDTPEFEFPRQIGKPLISTEDGMKELEDWFSYAKSLPTIEDELKSLVKPENMRNAIYIMHMPPANLSLDVCSDARRVGSIAIFNFIKKNQPLLTLHGHIHESPQMTNKWVNKIGNTLCIQPGQSNHYEKYLSYVIIDPESMKYERFSIEKPL
jgi:Icc-related predicted phosphoesterase